jgi:Nif-specific ferredoxin III
MPDGTNLTRDGTPWEPLYLDAIDMDKCIGCGRCFKVCDRNVMAMMGVDEDGGLIEPDDDEAERMVMTIAAKGACIGCNACARVCGSGAMTHVTAAQASAL